jgi:hypothetical protein
MKKISIIVLLIVLITTFSKYTFAQSGNDIPTPTISKEEITDTPIPTDSTMEKIQDLKNRIATKVAELKLMKKRVFTGKIISLNDPYVTISTKDGDKKIETNEDTLFSSVISGKSKDIVFKDFKKDQNVITWGSYNQEGDILTSKEIVVKDTPLTLVGTITDIDLKGGTVTLKTEQQTYLLDIEVYSKINTIDKTGKLIKLGFSKVQTESLALVQAVIIIKKDEITYTANRTLIIPPKDEIISPTITPSPIPTITKVVTPTKKPTPTIKIDTTKTP